MNELVELGVLHLICDQRVAEYTAVYSQCRVQRVEAGGDLHTLYLIDSITVSHVYTSVLKLRSAVREFVLNDEILRALCIDERCDVGMLRGDDRRHILDAECLELLLYRLCWTRGDLIDHGPREADLVLILQILYEGCRNEALLLPLLGHGHDGAHELLTVEQLSQETIATGYCPALKRSNRSAVTMAIAAPGFSGPLSMSACTNGKYWPSAFFSA